MSESTDKTKSSAILAITALALALNLHGLAVQSFWGDEILTASFAAQSPVAIVRWTAGDIHPPLYYLFAGAFTGLTVPLGADLLPSATSDWLWRYGSVLAVVITVPVTFRLALSMLQGIAGAQQAAIAAALLLCLAPVAVKYGQEARMHALFMCFSALATWFFFRAMQQPRQWRRWLLFALVTTANIYTMYFGFLVLAAQGGYLICTVGRTTFGSGSSSRPSQTEACLTGFSLACLLAFVLYGPWWPVLFNILRQRVAVGAIEGGVGNPLQFLAGIVTALGPLPAIVAWGFMVLFFVGLLFLAHRDWPLAMFAALWLVLPVVLPILLGDPRALQFRYAFVLPVYLTVVGYTLTIVSGRWAKAGEPGLAGRIWAYRLWLLATLSFVATLATYQQVKPNWREAAAYLTKHTLPADIILIGPLWDEGRFIGYYYRGEAQLLTPGAMLTNIVRRADSLRQGGGRIWAVNRFAPAESPASKNVVFAGVVISEPQLAVFEAELLTQAAIDLAAQAVEAAYPWAAQASREGVINPDPRTAKAGALRAWGDALLAANRPAEAVVPYQQAVDSFPGWVDGYLALARAQAAAGNLAAAAATYGQAVEFNPKWHGPEATRAAALAESGDWPAAIALYQQIVD